MIYKELILNSYLNVDKHRLSCIETREYDLLN